MTTKVKKKGVLAYQEAPQRKNRADCSSRSRRESLQFKSTNPLQETEKCSWPKINLAVPFSHKILQPVIILTSGLRKKKFFLFYLASIWIMDDLHSRACVSSRIVVILCQWEREEAQRTEVDWGFSSTSKCGGQLPFLAGVDALIWNDI